MSQPQKYTHKIPLHISPEDHSDRANMARLVHRLEMARRNPQGFIQYGKKRGITKPKLNLRADRLARALDVADQ